MKKFIPIAEPVISTEEIACVNDALKSGWVSSIGEYINKFEESFSQYCETKFGISTNNGTAALHLALLALDIKEGDEVIIPAFTFVATANAVKYTGAQPVLVDVEPDTWCLDPEKIEEKITAKTKAIIVVHIYGHPADMDKINDIAQRHNLRVIEDAAEAHGALYKDKKVGSLSDIGVFSFYGNKLITCGEGGMLVTNDEKIRERANFLKDHGMDHDRRYWHPEIGYNYRMMNLQAALGYAQLQKIDSFFNKKRENAFYYNEKLKNIAGITLPTEKNWAQSSCWMYSVLIDQPFPKSRDEIMMEFHKENIGTRPMFYPINALPPYKTDEKYPVSERLSKTGISLPSSVTLTREDIDRITEILCLNWISKKAI